MRRRTGGRAAAGPTGWSTPAARPAAGFDDRFVGGALHHEPSAAERGHPPGPQPWRPHTPLVGDARRRPGRSVLGLVLVLVLGTIAWRLPGPQGAGLPDELRLVVVQLEGESLPPEVVDGVAHEVGLAVTWLQTETGGVLRGDVTVPEVVTVPVTRSGLAGTPDDANAALVDAVGRLDPRAGRLPIIVTTAATADIGRGASVCGMGSPLSVVVFLGNCDQTPTVEAGFGSELSDTVAHELVHALGAVESCAPHATADGHVTDDRSDLMWGGPRYAPSIHATLDAGADDYWGHQNPGCPDIADSPLWVLAPTRR